MKRIVLLILCVASAYAADDLKTPLLSINSNLLPTNSKLSNKGTGTITGYKLAITETEIGRIVRIDRRNVYILTALLQHPTVHHRVEDCPATYDSSTCCKRDKGCDRCACAAHPLIPIPINKNTWDQTSVLPESFVALRSHIRNNNQVAWVNNHSNCCWQSCSGVEKVLWYGEYTPAKTNK